jgi:N-methylhydantoinase B/oxoprolinase/acetone carboxylase alpha subunit
MKELVKPILMVEESKVAQYYDECCGGNCGSNSKDGVTGNCGYNTKPGDDTDDILF